MIPFKKPKGLLTFLEDSVQRIKLTKINKDELKVQYSYRHTHIYVTRHEKTRHNIVHKTPTYSFVSAINTYSYVSTGTT